MLTSLALVLSCQTLTIKREVFFFERPVEMGEPRQGRVSRPGLSGLPEPLLSRVKKAVSFEVVFSPDTPLNESGAVTYNFEDDYSTSHGVLSITLRLELMGAYPSTEFKAVNVDLLTGNTITPTRAFTNLSGLAKMAERIRKANVARSLREASDEDKETIRGQLHGEFTTKNLDQFRVGDSGVTFVYDYDFIHAVKSLEPEGKLRFTWRQMKPFINQKGSLARFLSSN